MLSIRPKEKTALCHVDRFSLCACGHHRCLYLVRLGERGEGAEHRRRTAAARHHHDLYSGQFAAEQTTENQAAGNLTGAARSIAISNAVTGITAELTADAQAAAVLITNLHGDGVAGIEYIEVARALADGSDTAQAITYYNDAVSAPPHDVPTRSDALRNEAALLYALGQNAAGHQDMMLAARVFHVPDRGPEELRQLAAAASAPGELAQLHLRSHLAGGRALHRTARPGRAGSLAGRDNGRVTVLRWASLATPVGDVWIGRSQGGVARVHIGARPAGGGLDGDGGREPDAVLDSARAQLSEYFSGRRRAFDVPLDWGALTEPQRQVLGVLAGSVSYGQTISYGVLAQRSGLQPGGDIPARAVGKIMGSNPIPLIVPCHRVVASDGLGGYSGGTGPEVKRWLLILEGALPPTLDWSLAAG